MGGSIGITVREENGKEHRMCRWTNTLPWLITNIRLLNKDPAHIGGYLQRWDEMVEDFKKHSGDKKFEYPMTPVYAPYPFLAPHGYGLVVVDLQQNHILTSQGYTELGSIYSSG